MLMTKNGAIKAAAVSSAASLTLILTLGAASIAHAQTVRPGTTLALPCAANFDSTACGAVSRANGENTTALGAGAEATVFNSVAIGTLSVTDRESTVSVGRVGEERQIVNVADGTEATDAVNLGQMEAGDAATLTAANTYTDARETAIRTDMAAGDAATLTAANSYTDDREIAIRTDMAAGDAATLTAATTYTDVRETAIRTDMAAGDAATLTAANIYADAGDVRTLNAAMAYTDQGLAAFNERLTGVDARLDGQERRIDRLGAMSSAQLNMAMNAAGASPGRGRVAVGLGFQNGEEALSVGYGRRLANGVSVSVGGAFGRGGERSGGVGFGFELF